MTNPTEAPMANAVDDVKGEPDYFAVHSVTGSHIGLWKDETFARNVLKEYVGGTITPLYRASPAPSQHTGWSDEAVSKALRKLAAEVGGLRTFEGELRAELGNTNWSVLMLRLAEADAALAASSIAPATGFQDRVAAAHVALFHDDPTDLAERRDRFGEEANEVQQALGQTREDAHRLVDYTYDRPAGEPEKEIGAAALTLASLCVVGGWDMMASAEADLSALVTPEKIAKVRAKRSTRHGRGPLPGISPSVAKESGEP